MKKLLAAILATTLVAAAAPFFSESFDGAPWAPGPLKEGRLPGLAIVTSPVSSAPHALQIAREAPQKPALTDLRFPEPAPTDQNLVMTFKFRVAERSRGDLALTDQKGGKIAALTLRPGQLPMVMGGDGYVACRELPKVVADQWLTYEITVNAAAGNYQLALIGADGQRIVASLTPALQSKQPIYGIRFYNSPNGGTAYYDDITVNTAVPEAVCAPAPAANAANAAAPKSHSAADDLKRITDHLKSAEPEYWRWVFYGDSITHGYGNTKGRRCYCELFQECLRFECGFPRRKDVVINSGISGQNTSSLAPDACYVPMVQALKPNVVFLMIGANDIVEKGMTTEKFSAALGKMVDRVRQDGAIPVLQTFNTMRKKEVVTEEWHKGYVLRYEQFPAYNQAIRDVAAKHDCLLVDHYKHWEKEAADPAVLKSWLDDELHPGARGHYEMAKVLLEFFGMATPNSRVLKNVP